MKAGRVCFSIDRQPVKARLRTKAEDVVKNTYYHAGYYKNSCILVEREFRE